MIYLQLFLAFCWIGLTSFGGGYAALAPIEEATVAPGWLSATEFADVVALSQTTPGPIAINAATFCGAKVAGVPGALVATAGVVVPSFVIVLSLALLYRKYSELQTVRHVLTGLRPATTGIIAAAGLSLAGGTLLGAQFPQALSPDYAAIVLFAAALFVLRKWKVNQVWVILASGALWVLWEGVRGYFQS
ncbi:MAG: chromate transporter [Oscillospiraceae bacterium]|nr:chromate transporter [Oscillospiraceae bacterium]